MYTKRNTRQIRVDRKIHQHLKILCVERGVSIQDLATSILADYLAENMDYEIAKTEVR